MGPPGPRALRAAARPAYGRPLTRATPPRNRQQPGGQAGSNKLHPPGPGPQASGHCRGAPIRLTSAGSTDKQGSAWLRWVFNQAAQTAKRSPEFHATYTAIARRCGKKIATIAIARKLLTRAYHLLAAMQEDAPAASAATAAPAAPTTGRVTKPRARSLQRHEPASSQARSSD
jgi:hypothetical protein